MHLSHRFRTCIICRNLPMLWNISPPCHLWFFRLANPEDIISSFERFCSWFSVMLTFFLFLLGNNLLYIDLNFPSNISYNTDIIDAVLRWGVSLYNFFKLLEPHLFRLFPVRFLYRSFDLRWYVGVVICSTA